VQQHRFAATIFDYVIFPFMLHHPRPAMLVEAKPITTKTLTLLMRWQQVAQAMKMARVKYDAEVRGLPAQARATADQVRELVRRKFPSPPLDAEAIPTQADLPKQDWKTGAVEWMDGTTDQIAEQMKTFGGESARIEVESLREAVRRLSKQKSAGVDTVSKDGQASTVLKPFVDMCLAGSICLSGRHADPACWTIGASAKVRRHRAAAAAGTGLQTPRSRRHSRKAESEQTVGPNSRAEAGAAPTGSGCKGRMRHHDLRTAVHLQRGA
jgi:hypothetical protein